MSVTDEYLKNNEAYASTFSGPLPLPPSKHVAVVACMDFAAATKTDFSVVSRVIQGVLTGIGFLGAGVIIRGASESRVHGLTTAACTWLVACIGVACGFAGWRVIVIAVILAFLILMFGGPIEQFVHKRRVRAGEDGGAPLDAGDARPGIARATETRPGR